MPWSRPYCTHSSPLDPVLANHQRLSDGAVVAGVAATPTAMAISADGSTIAVGSAGLELLSTWRPSMGLFAQTCFGGPQVSGGTSLSADGRTIAVTASATQVQVLRREDGTLLSTIGLGLGYEIRRSNCRPTPHTRSWNFPRRSISN